MEQDKIMKRVGEPFTVVLESSPSAGYLWRIKDCPIEFLTKFRPTEYLQTAPLGVVGSKVIQVFHFKGVRRGRGTLVFSYGRAWEPESLHQELSYPVVIS